jgi:hypothetical protein
MIRPVELDLTVQRHAAFPSVDPFALRDSVTGVPIDVTGATITMQVRLYDGTAGDPLLSKTLSVVSGPNGTFGPPAISESEHEGLPTTNAFDPKPLTRSVRFRYDVKASGITGFPASVILMRGDYIVQDGANV